MDKKRILQVITRLDKGGSAENTLLVSEFFNNDKYETILLYGGDEHPDKQNFKSINLPELQRNISPIDDIKAFFKLYNIIKQIKPDIVHTNTSKAGFLGRWAAFFYNIVLRVTSHGSRLTRIIHTPHGHVFYGYEFNGMKSKLYLLLETITAPITDKILALTEGEKRESIQLGIGKASKWEVVHCSIDIEDSSYLKNDVRKEFNIEDSAVLIGTVARLVPVKGIINFVEAVSMLERQNFPYKLRYIIVGDGEERQNIENKAKEFAVFDKIIFTGMRKDVMRLMSAMDIYVQPSLNEGLGKTLVQAHYIGLPIVATKVQGIPDVVKDGISGFLVKPGSPENLSDKIKILIEDKQLRESFGSAGKKLVTSKDNGYLCFSTPHMMFLLGNIYDSLN